MAGGESIYEDGGVGAQGSCEVGEKCLESEGNKKNHLVLL